MGLYGRYFWTTILIVACAIPSGATTIHLKSDGTGDYPTIQEGINAATDGDTVLLAAGTYTGAGNKSLYFYGKAITLTSASGPEATIIDCEQNNPAFWFRNGEGPSSVVSRLTIANGRGPAGGAIMCEATSPTITGNVFIGNRGDRGGAIWCHTSSAIIVNNTFTENNGNDGGAIGCTNSSSSLMISDNTFIRNKAIYQGGAIFCDWSSPTIYGNTLVSNDAAQGGGISAYRSSFPIIENTIIAFSTRGQGVSSGTNGCTVTNCDVFGNVGGDALPASTIDGGGNFSADPLFCGTEGSDNYFLNSASPCAPVNHLSGLLIGAWPVGCGVVAVEPSTWGRLKALYWK